MLEEMEHKQPLPPVQTDNTTALVVVKNNIMKKTQIDGHETSLVTMTGKPEPILTLLGDRKKQTELSIS